MPDFLRQFSRACAEPDHNNFHRLPGSPYEIRFNVAFTALLRLIRSLPKWLQVTIGKSQSRSPLQQEPSV